MIHLSKNLEDTRALAQSFVLGLSPRSAATVVSLVGDLGSGKTAFSQFVGAALGVEESMQSPTFLIEKIYELKDKPWKHLIHIDAYRLEKSAELLNLGWQKLIESAENLVLVEWADKIEDILPVDTVRLNFRFVDENTREIEVESKEQEV